MDPDAGPRRRDADRSRAAILDAAEELFAARGFADVTMAQIGAAAGVSRGTPGYFFGSKAALYQVVVARAQETVRRLAQTLRVRDAAGARDADVRVADAVRALLALLTSRRSLVRLIDREAARAGTTAHAEAVRDALGDGADGADHAVLVALALCWFPLSQPDAARAAGVDPDRPDFVTTWHGTVMRALGTAAQPADDPPPPDGSAVADAPRKRKKHKGGKKKRKRAE